MTQDASVTAGQLHTLGLLERLREDLRKFGEVKNDFMFV